MNKDKKENIKEYKVSINIDEIKEITDGDMRKELLALSESSFWTVMMKYVGARIEIVDESLRSINPIDNAYQIALHQGIRHGLLDLPGMIEAIKEQIKKEESKKSKQEDIA